MGGWRWRWPRPALQLAAPQCRAMQRPRRLAFSHTPVTLSHSHTRPCSCSCSWSVRPWARHSRRDSTCMGARAGMGHWHSHCSSSSLSTPVGDQAGRWSDSEAQPSGRPRRAHAPRRYAHQRAAACITAPAANRNARGHCQGRTSEVIRDIVRAPAHVGGQGGHERLGPPEDVWQQLGRVPAHIGDGLRGGREAHTRAGRGVRGALRTG